MLWQSMIGAGIAMWAGTATAQPVLTVLRDPTLLNWGTIATQLDTLDARSVTLDLPELTQERLRDVEVLFIPVPGRLNAQHVELLRAWVETEQGRLVVSGLVRNGEPLSRVIGGYWSTPLSGPQPVAATSFSDNDWAPADPAEPIPGGVLVPLDIGSRLSATWSDQPGSPAAVLANPHSVYLGWDWGNSPAVDQAWLQAALDRFAGQISSRPPTTATAAQPQALSELPVNTLEMLSMRQELGNLLGRVESAILTTDANQNTLDSLPLQFRTVVAEARTVLDSLPQWVESGQYQRVRQEFEQARTSLWQNYPVDHLTALPEVRAIWLDRGTIVEAGSKQGLAEVFDRLAAAGINTVFFETINAGFPIYPSRVAPAQNPLTRHWDPLRAAVELAREREIELHAWMWTFAVGNTRHNVLPAVNLPPDYIGPVLTANPEWANISNRGQLFPPGQPETWLDPANPEVRHYLTRIVTELIEDYGVDGIQLDYIRYPFQNPGSDATFGYGQAARQQFEHLTGIDPFSLNPTRDRSLWQLWTDFRAQQVSEVVALLGSHAHSLNPRVIMSTAVYAMPYNERMQKLQQEWETWISQGDIDLLVPMTYAENTRRLEQLVRPNLEVVTQAPVLFLPSVNLLDLPAVEFLDQMQIVRDLPTGGYSLFAARQLDETFQDILSQSRVPVAQVPYRYPFAAAVERFAVLQQEWQVLLANDQIWMSEAAATEWQAQTEQLATKLVALAEAPSVASVEQAQVFLADYVAALPEWMRLESLERPYRIETWQNRLASLAVLLRFGGRTVLQSEIVTTSS